MALLKKIKASTLMETLVATVLIVLLFMMASLLLNSIFSASVSANNQFVAAHLEQLEYRYTNGAITLPYYEELEDWNIALAAENVGSTSYLVIEATNTQTKKQLKTYSALAH